MKLLLVAVNAKYIHSNLALYSLRAYASKYSQKKVYSDRALNLPEIKTMNTVEQKGFAENIVLAEYTINNSEEDILKGIYKEKAEVIAFSCYIWNIDIILRVIGELKKVQPKAIIWLGGPEVSYDAVQCLSRYKDIDGVMIGEGEQTFLELMEHYVDGTKELEQINGLAFRVEAEQKDETGPDTQLNVEQQYKEYVRCQDDIIVTPVRQPIPMDTIPFPYENMEDFNNKIIYYESSRGCPFSCSYCLSSIDKRVRLRSTELVKKELQFLLDNKVPQVKFIDRTFNCNKKHAMEIWRFIRERDNGITNFHFEISADLLDEEELELLAMLRPAQVQLEIGVQTTNPNTVAAIHRNTNLDRLKCNVTRIKEGKNIHQHLDLIAGLPLEDYASFEKSFQVVYDLKPDQLQLGFLKVLKGSLMEEESRAYGIVYRNTAPYEVLYTKHMTFDEILKLKGVCEMVEIYYNTGQFTTAINFLEQHYTSPIKLYEAVHTYYESKCIDLLAHSRIRRYEILLDFYKDMILPETIGLVATQLSDYIKLFEEILLMDLFLRENLKSRPSFARSCSQNNNFRAIYDQYRKENRIIHIEPFTYDIIASVKAGKPIKKDIAFLFEYSNRDPIHKSAIYTELE